MIMKITGPHHTKPQPVHIHGSILQHIDAYVTIAFLILLFDIKDATMILLQ
ncbi:hypothetical protein V6Z12_A07G110200 [Gossypium hirsutum]